ARAVGGHFHALRRVAAAGRRKDAFAFHFHDAGAAVAVGAQRARIAQVRNRNAVLARRLDDRLIRTADDGLAVELELDRQRRQLFCADAVHAYSTSCGKYFITVSAGFGAACPRPQIEASIIACESSLSNGWFQRFASMSPSALAVPTRQGVHWPQDSSLKNFIRFLAAAVALSLLLKTTMA